MTIRPVPSDCGRDTLLGASQARRVIVSLIAEEQDRLLRAQGIAPDQLIARVLADHDPEADIPIDEDALGFDSLKRLDLVARLTRFFGLDATGVEDYLVVERNLNGWARLVAGHFASVGRDAQVTFATSGSTGAPTRVRHGFAALESEVDAILRGPLDRLASDGRILCHIEPRHVYGFIWSVLLPASTGREVVDLARGLPSAVFRAAAPGDIVLSTPFSWQRMAEAGSTLPDGVIGITSGGAADASTWAAARSIGLSKLIDIYGSTETGGVGWRQDESRPYRLMADVEIEGDAVTGRRSQGCAVPLPDHVRSESPGCFSILGRRDTVVQVASVNVNLTEVADVLRAHPEVTDAVLRLDGERLKAFVVPVAPHQDPDPLETRLRRHAAACLSAAAQPARYAFGASLPRGPGGKLADW